MRRLRKETRPISFMKHHYSAGLNRSRQGSKSVGWVRKKLKNEAANHRIERRVGRSRGHFRFSKAHIAKSKLRRACSRLFQGTPIEINANDFAGWPDESGHKERNIADSRPYVQHTLARTNPRIAEQSLSKRL